MKTIISIAIIFLLTGCDGFLEEQSQGEVRPSTLHDMKKILTGNAYPLKSEGLFFNQETELFTDNWKCDNPTMGSEISVKEKKIWRFSWDRRMFDDGGGGEDVSLWKLPYEKIKGCNVVLDYVDKMDGDVGEREYMKGEAYTLRGYYYLMVVNFFSLPYNEGDPAVNPGVPLKLISGVSDEKFARKSVKEVYTQIGKDLLEGAKLMKEHDILHADIYRLKPISAYALLTRMYLYMEDWDNVIKYADSVLAESPELHDLASNVETVYSDNSKELLWASLFSMSNTSSKTAFTLSDELIGLYGMDLDNEVKDLRGDITDFQRYNNYLYAGNPPVFCTGINKSLLSSNSGGIRTSEVYLNRAEAYVRKYVESGNQEYGKLGLADLNELRSHRFFAGYEDKKIESFENAEELLAFCLRERRRELCGEGNHRWFDLRRTGMPKIVHTFFYEEGENQYFTLEEKDLRYALPIPAKVLERNTGLVQNNY